MEIIYGIRNDNGKVVSIDEIPNDKPGLQCNCICTYCKGALQACSLNGLVRRYFRHHTEAIDANSSHRTRDCSSYSANETALHLMAKQIIADEKKILVPPKNISMFEAGITDIPHEIENKVPPYELQKTRSVVAENVELEKPLDGFTPDVFIKTARGELLVEIFVHHQVGEFKKEKVAERGSAMLEINLSKFVDTPVKSDELKSVILSSEKHKEWIYYPLSSESLIGAKHYYDNLDVVKNHRRRVLEKKRRLEREHENSVRRNQKIKELFESEKYAAESNRLRNDDAFLASCEKWHKGHWFPFAQHYRQHKEAPFFIDIPITGEMVFKCDRRIWQSLIFNRYIYGRKEDGARIHVDGIFDALKDDYNIEIDYDLTYKLTDPRNDARTIHLRRDVIRTYMDYLEEIGFVISSFDSSRQDWRTVQARRTINPPLCDEANALSLAIKSANTQSPDIDIFIDRKVAEYYNEQQKIKLAESKKRDADMLELKKNTPIIQENHPVNHTKSDILYNQPSHYKQSEEMPRKKTYQEDEKTHNPQPEPIAISNDQRIWRCVYCEKEKTKKAFSKFISMEENLGICTMCFHISRQRNQQD